MSQYRPVYRAARLPVIARGVRPDEVRAAVKAARSAGLQNVLVDGGRGRPTEP
jgi:uncharacterized Fe-S radical SAM superfamily protein PflX